MTRWISNPWAGPAFAVIYAAVMAGIALLSYWTAPSSSSWGRTVAKCDEAVRLMLTTDDPVELQRSIFLIERLDCAVQRRLPGPQ